MKKTYRLLSFKSLRTLLLAVCVLTVTPVFSDDQFLAALKAFQSKDYAEAEKNYVTLLETNPKDPTLLTNLGLTYWEMQKKGLAIGYFRHALNLNPSFEPAQKALSHSLSEFAIENPPHDTVALEWVRLNLLAPASIWTLALVHLLTFVGLAWCVLTLAKKNQDPEKGSSAGLLGIISLFGLLWIFSLVLLILKVSDQLKMRGTITSASISAFALPDANSVSLMELKEGVEVIIRGSQKDWTQVNFPGAATGWIPNSSVYIHQRGL